MSGMPPNQQQQQQTRQVQGQGAAANPVNPLPPTGLQQQAASAQMQTAPPLTIGGQGPAANPQQMGARQPGMGFGQTSLAQLARSLSSNYGLQLGRNDLVDAQGNFLMTPDQLAEQSGGRETKGSAAAKFNLIADAIQRRQQQQQMQKSEAALQAGLGLVQSRGRGSLAAMQSGFYEGLANLYQQQQYQAADFSYFIQAEQFEIQRDMLRRQEKLQKKRGIGGMLGGVAGMLIGGPGGAAVGSAAGEQIGSWF